MSIDERLHPEPFDLRRKWRAKGDKPGDAIKGASPFDEVVVGSWLHFESMGNGAFWGRVGPLVLSVRKRGPRVSIRVSRDSDDHLYDVTIDGDLTVDVVSDGDLRRRVIGAYEASRKSKKSKPDPEKLRTLLARVIGARR